LVLKSHTSGESKRGLKPLFLLIEAIGRAGMGRKTTRRGKGAGLKKTLQFANVYREKNYTEEKTD